MVSLGAILLIQTAASLGMVWLLLFVIGLKFRSAKPLRGIYSRAVLALCKAIARWLWVTPRVRREVSGSYADPYVRLDEEDEQWR